MILEQRLEAMANPRKFSEKIALHNQKQAEETAKFEQIMREVSDVTAKVLPVTSDRDGKHTLRINQTLGTFRGGSLPNVSAGASKTPPHNDKPDQDPHNMHQQQQSPHHHGHQHQQHHQQQHQQPVYRESRNRSMGVGPMRPRAIERRIDTSPYLSPPPDINWRRTNSDSALHQSAMQGLVNDRIDSSSGSGSRWNLSGSVDPNDGRPRSSCDVPRVPGINIYPSAQEPGIIQIPIGNNTGSLPDLTSVHFPSPLHTPIDQEADHSSSPYSSSPVSASPATLSPTSVPPGLRSPQGQGQFQFSNRHMSQHHNSNHLSVPMQSRYLHHNKGVTLENNIQGLGDGVNFSQTALGLTELQNMYQQQQQQCPTSSPSPTLQQPTISGPGYRSPLPRPSPQSSPGLGGRHSAPSSPAAPNRIPEYYLSSAQATLLQQHFEQFSMDWAQLVQSLVESGCTWSAQVQVDSPAVVNYGGIDSSGAASVQLSQQAQQQQQQAQQSHSPQLQSDHDHVVTSICQDLANDTSYYTTSPTSLGYPTAPTSLHTTPNTPTSIPDIILTDCSNTKYNTIDPDRLGCGVFVDFSNATDDLNRQEYSKELSNVIGGTLDGDLFPSDDSLREGLGHLDFDGLQMLSDPDINVISDNAEDNFRLDRL